MAASRSGGPTMVPGRTAGISVDEESPPGGSHIAVDEDAGSLASGIAIDDEETRDPTSGGGSGIAVDEEPGTSRMGGAGAAKASPAIRGIGKLGSFTIAEVERVNVGLLGSAQVLCVDSEVLLAGEIPEAALRERLAMFLTRLETAKRRQATLQTAETEYRNYATWFHKLQDAAKASSVSAALIAMVTEERRTQGLRELRRALDHYMLDGILQANEHEQMLLLAKQYWLSDADVQKAYADWGRDNNQPVPVPQAASRTQGGSLDWKPHPSFKAEDDTARWNLEQLQSRLLSQFDVGLEVANLEEDKRLSLFAYLEDRDPEAAQVAKRAKLAADDADSRELAVWYFLWATGRKELHLGGTNGRVQKGLKFRISRVEDLGSLLPEEFVLGHLGDAIERGYVEHWATLVLKSQTVAAAARQERVASRSVAHSLRKMFLRAAALRVMWAMGIDSMQLWDGSQRPILLTKPQSLHREALSCLQALDWALKAGCLKDWLSRFGKGWVDCAVRAERMGSKDHARLACGLGVWHLLFEGGWQKAFLLADGETQIATLEEFEAAVHEQWDDLRPLIEQGTVAAWLEFVQAKRDLAQAIRSEQDLTSDPRLAAETILWSERKAPLKTSAGVVVDVDTLRRAYGESPEAILRCWEAKRLSWWLRFALPGDKAKSLLARVSAMGREQAPHAVVWLLGEKRLRFDKVSVSSVEEVWRLPEGTIRKLVENDLLPLWLELSQGKSSQAKAVREEFRNAAPSAAVQLVLWAIGAKGIHVGNGNPTTIPELLGVADQFRADLWAAMKNGQLRAWLKGEGASDEVLRFLDPSVLNGVDDVGFDLVLEEILCSLGAPRPRLEVTPSRLDLGRLPEGERRPFNIVISNAGPRGILSAAVTTSAGFISPETQTAPVIAVGQSAMATFEASFPVGGQAKGGEFTISVASNAGSVDVRGSAYGGIAWGKVLVPGIVVGLVGAAAGAGARLGLGALVDDVIRRDWAEHASKVGVVPAVILLLGAVGYGALRYFSRNS